MKKGSKFLKKITIGGYNQYILPEIIDNEKPICLFIHGGPGTPIPFGISAEGQFKSIYQKFNPVFWDQRGCGKSYNTNINADSITLNELINDANEIMDYLLKTYNKDKIYLLGHSFGTIITLNLAKMHPEKIKKIYNISQLVSMPLSNKIAYNNLLKIANETNNTYMLNKLNQLENSNFNTYKDMQIIWTLAPKYLTTIPEHFGKFMLNACKSKNYSFIDILNNLTPVKKLYMNFFNNILDLDLLNEDLNINVPIHFYQGKGDYRCPLELLEKLNKHINSQFENKITILKNSGHNPSVDDINYIFDTIEY